jgi:2,3-dihydro-2,3-dihydroxybenzoate dehydrogenase
MSLTVVVGAARGIGRAVAEELARGEPKKAILLADVDGDQVQQLARTLVADGIDATGLTVDVGDPDSVAALVAQSRTADRVAITAGIFRSSPTLTTPVAEFETVLRVNTVGCFHVAQQYAAAMAEAEGGAIVAVTSIAARMPRMRQAAYSASKAALRQALRVLSMEVAQMRVRINTVSPGPTDTEMMQQLASDHASVHDLAVGSPEAFRPRIPAGRVASVADIAAAVSFLLSPASQHVYMADLVVDGGELLGM